MAAFIAPGALGALGALGAFRARGFGALGAFVRGTWAGAYIPLGGNECDDTVAV